MADELAEGPAIAEPETVEADAEAVEANADTAAAGAKPSEPQRDKLQERFDKLTREKYDAMRRADQLEYQLSQIQAREAQTRTVAPSMPTLESVGFDETKYTQAVLDYARTAVATEAKSVLERERSERAAQERSAAFDKAAVEFAKAKPDYFEKVMSPTLPVTPAMAEVIRESEMGPQLAYFLADNPDRAYAIAQMAPAAAARELGRIEARLESDVKPKAPAVSKAPPPPPKIDASADEVENDPDKMNDDDWLKWRNRQLRRKR